MPVTAHFRVGDTHKWELDTRYEGAVLEVGSRTVQVMSDIWDTEFYAKVWDEATGKPLDVSLYYSNESSSEKTKACKATVDATPEVKEAYRRWKIDRAIEDRFRRRLRDLESEAIVFRKDDIAKVVKGRTATGVEGKVVVVLEKPYRAGWSTSFEKKLGIATSDRTEMVLASNGRKYERYQDVVWVWARNCEKLNYVPVDQVKLLEEVRNEIEGQYRLAA